MTDHADGCRQGRPHNSDWLDWAIRAGLICYGVVHLLVGWLSLQLAFGRHEREGVQQGGHAGAVAAAVR